MAVTSTLVMPLSANLTALQNHTITDRFRVNYESVTSDRIAVLLAARLALPDPVPVNRQRYAAGVDIFAETFAMTPTPENREYWYIDVSYQSPQNKDIGNFGDLHPLFHPPTVTLDYLEKEFVIEEARNVQALTGVGYERAANTLGPVVNGVKQETAEALIDSIRNPVIVIRRNVPSLENVYDQNLTYQLTTNSAAIPVSPTLSFGPKTLKFQGTDSADEQEFDDIPYWPIETRVEILKTAIRTVQSTGWKVIGVAGDNPDDCEGKLTAALDDCKKPISEPVFIGLNGKKSKDEVTIEYEYLDAVPYAPIFT